MNRSGNRGDGGDFQGNLDIERVGYGRTGHSDTANLGACIRRRWAPPEGRDRSEERRQLDVLCDADGRGSGLLLHGFRIAGYYPKIAILCA